MPLLVFRDVMYFVLSSIFECISWTQRYEEQIKRCVSNMYLAVHPRVIFTSRHLIPAVKKDVLPASKFSNIIYELKCRCDARYVGRTTQTLTDRIKQHVPLSIRKNTIGPWIQPVRACRKVPASIPTSCASAIGQHFIENANSAEHYNVDAFKILMLIISIVMEHIQIQ